MNVATTASVTSSSNTTSAQAQSSKTTSSTKDKSFDEEMKTAKSEDSNSDVKKSEKSEKTDKSSKKDTNKKTEKTAEKVSEELDKIGKDDDLVDLANNINFTDYKYGTNSRSILSQNIQSLLDTKDLMNTVSMAATVEYDALNMSYADANFFANLVQNTDMSFDGILNQINNGLTDNSQNIQQSLQVSSVLLEKLTDSMNNNKPFRIDFDKDISVIIKVNKDGSLSANFIPGDKAVEQYLRNNIDSLRQRFDEENLPYSQLSYSNSNREQQKQRKKENNNE